MATKLEVSYPTFADTLTRAISYSKYPLKRLMVRQSRLDVILSAL